MSTSAHEPARKVGSLTLELLSDTRRGRVLGAFSKALALEFGGFAVTLTPVITGLPFGISVPSLPLSQARGWLGMEVEATPSLVAIPEAGWGLSLAGTPVWDGKKELARLAPTSPAITRSAAQLEAWLAEHGGASSWIANDAPPISPGRQDRSMATAFDAALHSAMADLRVGLLQEDWDAQSAAVVRLLGAGPGLTPAGDDFLAGLVLTLSSPSDRPSEGLDRLRGFIESQATQRTNIYGRSVLHAACSEHATETISSALASLLGGRPDAPLCLEQLASLGATSGLDTLQGLLAGLQVLGSPR